MSEISFRAARTQFQGTLSDAFTLLVAPKILSPKLC